MNLNLKSNLEYYQLFIRHLLTDCDDPSKGRVYELASIQFLTAILCDLGEEDPGHLENVHTMEKYYIHYSNMD